MIFSLHYWMSTNRLCLNATKTQLIWFGTRQQLSKLDFQLLTEKFPAYTYSSSVRDLGVTLDSSLTFTEHISNLTRSCFFQLRRLRAIRRSGTDKDMNYGGKDRGRDRSSDDWVSRLTPPSHSRSTYLT